MLDCQGAEAAALTQRRVVLAQNLIVNLRDRGTSKSVRNLADKLLEKLLRSFGDLIWQPELLSSLLNAFDALDATGYPIAVDSRISSWLRKVTLPPLQTLAAASPHSIYSLFLGQRLFQCLLEGLCGSRAHRRGP